MPEANAVFEGGGVKGLALAGALAVAEERGYTWHQLAGTSAGAMVAALVAAGYTAAELAPVMDREVNFAEFIDRGWRRRLPLLALLWRRGMFSGDYARRIMEHLLARKLGRTGATFGDLPRPCKMIAADITNRRLVVLPDGLTAYGWKNPLGFPVAEAVRASISIPFFFEPYVLRYQLRGQRHSATLVDGGLLSNFPVWLFDPGDHPPERPTIGFLLQEPDSTQPWPTDCPTEFVRALLATALEARDAYTLSHQDFERTIEIDTGDVKSTDFHLTAERREWLYQSGRRAAERFFGSFDFRAWVERFGGGNGAGGGPRVAGWNGGWCRPNGGRGA